MSIVSAWRWAKIHSLYTKEKACTFAEKEEKCIYKCLRIRYNKNRYYEGDATVIEKSFAEVYDRFKLQFYRKIFELVRERDGSLSAMEAFSLEVIRMLDRPTVGQFADFLNISQSNATYKVNNLIKKGYLERQHSQVDRREYYLILSDKFYHYAGLLAAYEETVISRMKERFSQEDLDKFDEMLQIMIRELMPETN